MNCPQCEALFASYIEGLLDDGLVGEFETHVADCPTCRIALEETHQIVDRLTRNSNGMSVSSMSTAVMERILQEQGRRPRRASMYRFSRIAIAASLLVTACAGIWYLVAVVGGGNVYASVPAAVKLIEQANTVTWKTKFYERRIRQDTKEQTDVNDFFEQTREFAYKAPGLYRDVTRDENGQIRRIDINDAINLKRLSLIPGEEKATLFHLTEPTYRATGPFTVELEYLRSENLEWLGRKKIAGSEANGFRYAFWFQRGNENQSYDFWIDVKTKQLVAHQVPGVDMLDPNKVYDEPASGMGNSGFLQYDIVFGAALDDSLFSFDVPEEYTLKVEYPVKVTEQELIDFLGIVARYFDNTFPDRMPGFDHGAERDRLEEVKAKPKAERTHAENRLVETIDKYMRMFLPGPGPTPEFIQANTVKGSWTYVGKGVKLGNKERIVCWYKPKGSQSFRVVHGDLSVEDVAREDLPLPVEP